ncbi:hypothetical protein D3C87_1410600 [compost metagenome]
MALSPLISSNGKNTRAHNSRRKPVSRIGSMAWLTWAAAENETAINKDQSNMPAWATVNPLSFMMGFRFSECAD